jgi:hypothetical protein
MNEAMRCKVITHKKGAFAVALVVGGLLMAPGAVLGAQSSSNFRITAQLQSAAAASTSAFCRSDSTPGSFGATLTVVCSTGIVVDVAPSSRGLYQHGDPSHRGGFLGYGWAYRYVTQVNWAGQNMGPVDIYSGIGTITSWRVVNLVDREYVEMTLNW